MLEYKPPSKIAPPHIDPPPYHPLKQYSPRPRIEPPGVVFFTCYFHKITLLAVLPNYFIMSGL